MCPIWDIAKAQCENSKILLLVINNCLYDYLTYICTYFTTRVWQFKNLIATQILREVKFGNFRGSKTAILAILEALNFESGENSTFESIENSQNL